MQENRVTVLLETTVGNIKIALYNETPGHRDNFVKNVKEKAYDGVLFHRVINEFMVQTGDPSSKTAKKGQMLGASDHGSEIPAEFVFPQYCCQNRRQCKSGEKIVRFAVLYCNR